MTKLRVHAFSISLDGYGAGPHQDRDNPLGVGGEALHEWIVATRTFQQTYGNEGGTTGEDDEFTARGFNNIGAKARAVFNDRRRMNFHCFQRCRQSWR